MTLLLYVREWNSLFNLEHILQGIEHIRKNSTKECHLSILLHCNIIILPIEFSVLYETLILCPSAIHFVTLYIGTWGTFQNGKCHIEESIEHAFFLSHKYVVRSNIPGVWILLAAFAQGQVETMFQSLLKQLPSQKR